MPADVSYTPRPVEKHLFYWVFSVSIRSEARLYSIFDACRCQNGPFMHIHVVNRGGSFTTETLRYGEGKFLPETSKQEESVLRDSVAPWGTGIWNAIMLEGACDLSCVICEIRKEKRFCPAVHGRICPQCCGEQREVTLDCPSDCVYLQQAREHEKPRPTSDLDRASLFLQVEVSEQFMYEKEHLLMGVTYALAKTARADRSLHDQDLIAALAMLASSYE